MKGNNSGLKLDQLFCVKRPHSFQRRRAAKNFAFKTLYCTAAFCKKYSGSNNVPARDTIFCGWYNQTQSYERRR